MKRLYFLLFVLLAGCSSSHVIRTEETVVRVDTLVVVPPVIRDTLSAIMRPDSIIQGVSIRGRDTITVVQYIPKTNTITLYTRPDTIHVPYIDTVEVIHNQIIEKTPLILEVLAFAFGIMVVVLIVYAVNKFK